MLLSLWINYWRYNMELTLLPVDLETGERIELTPSNIKQLGNDELANLTSNLKAMEKLKKEAEQEIKSRLDKGEKFTRASYPDKTTYTRVLKLDDEAKRSLIKNYGWDSVEPLSITKLEKKFGESIYEKLQPFIVEVPKAKAVQWDK